MEKEDLRDFFLTPVGNIDEESIHDEPAFGEALRAESELIDDFVTGSLSEEEKKRFITHYLISDDRLNRVSIASGLRLIASEEKRRRAIPVAFFTPIRRRLVIAGLAAGSMLLFGLAVGYFLFTENGKALLSDSMDSVSSSETATASKQNFTKTSSVATDRDVIVSRKETSSVDDLTDVSDPSMARDKKFSDRKTSDVALRIINDQSEMGFDAYSVVIADEDGRNWEVPIIHIAKGGKEIFVSIPTEDLDEGIYTLTLNGEYSSHEAIAIETTRVVISGNDSAQPRILLP